MNKVWEQFVASQISRSALFATYHIHTQATRRFWGSRTIRPDIYLEHRGDSTPIDWPNIIIDTKWKHNPQLVPADDDLKQMYVYNQYYQASTSLLIYPSTTYSQASISQAFALTGPAGPHFCHVCVIPVLAETGLTKRVAENIASSLIRTQLGG